METSRISTQQARQIPAYTIDWERDDFDTESSFNAARAVYETLQLHPELQEKDADIWRGGRLSLKLNIGCAVDAYRRIISQLSNAGYWTGTIKGSVGRIIRARDESISAEDKRTKEDLLSYVEKEQGHVNKALAAALDVHFILTEPSLLSTPRTLRTGYSFVENVRRAPAVTPQMLKEGRYEIASSDETDTRRQGHFLQGRTVFCRSDFKPTGSQLLSHAKDARLWSEGTDKRSLDPGLDAAFAKSNEGFTLVRSVHQPTKMWIHDHARVQDSFKLVRECTPRLLQVDLDRHARLRTNAVESFGSEVLRAWERLNAASPSPDLEEIESMLKTPKVLA